MIRILTWLVAVAWLLPAVVSADLRPAQGKFLVATDVVQGELFAETVVLLLHYDEHGAIGFVVNRPTEIRSEELLDEADAIPGYDGPIYWGGPVQMQSLRALIRTDAPSGRAEKIVETIHSLPFRDALTEAASDPDSVRLYLGHSGWGAGQLDGELARGSWEVRPASSEIVFSSDPGGLWEALRSPPTYRAAVVVGAN